MNQRSPDRSVLRRARDGRTEDASQAASNAEVPVSAATPEPTPAVLPSPQGPTLDASALLAELDALPEGGLEALMFGAATARRFHAGDRASGLVVRVTADTVFVDIGAKSEALMDRAEFEGTLPATGEAISAFVLSTEADGVRLARRLSGRAGLGMIEDAKEAEIPVEGRVEARNSGGFTVHVAGITAFCPVSQIDRYPDTDLDRYIGLSASFMVTDIRGKDVVVSRKAALVRDAAENAEKLWATIKEGDALDGVVAGVKEYGVFVDVGGVTGLMRRSEIGWDPDSIPPARGERVAVRVIEVDRDNRKLGLSMKDPTLGPWSRVGKDFHVGEVYPAKISRLTTFGAFASLAPGLDGLIHVSNLSKTRVEQPSHAVRPGQEVRVRVLGIDHERQRLELGIKQAEEGWEPDETERRAPAPSGPQSLGTMADLFSAVKLPSKAAPAAAPPGTRRKAR